MATALVATSAVAPSVSFICNGLNALSLRPPDLPTTCAGNPLQPQFGEQYHQGLSEDELILIRDEVSQYMIKGDLRRFNGLAIRKLKEIQCDRGMRYIQGLPWLGQRTKNNCRTLKGKRVAIAGKKKAPR